MEKIITISLIASTIIFLGGCTQQSVTEQTPQKVTVAKLVETPSLYVDKLIQVTSLVKRGTDGECYLEDGIDTMSIDCWAPDSVAQCAPSAETCSAPLAMPNYIDKQVKLSGTVKEQTKKEYINKKWIVVGTGYIIVNIKDPTIIK